MAGIDGERSFIVLVQLEPGLKEYPKFTAEHVTQSFGLGKRQKQLKFLRRRRGRGDRTSLMGYPGRSQLWAVLYMGALTTVRQRQNQWQPIIERSPPLLLSNGEF
jgi:hypothetical protein